VAGGLHWQENIVALWHVIGPLSVGAIQMTRPNHAAIQGIKSIVIALLHPGVQS
jgi:hypothetical protein